MGEILVQGGVGNRRVEIQIHLARRGEACGAGLREYVLFQYPYPGQPAFGHEVFGAHVHHTGGVHFPELVGQPPPQVAVVAFGEAAHDGVDKQLVHRIDGYETLLESVAGSQYGGRVGVDGNVERRYELRIVPRAPFLVDEAVGLGMRVEIHNHQQGCQCHEYLAR